METVFPMPVVRRKQTPGPAVAQQQYAPFRATYMDKKAYIDPLEMARGPGSLESPLAVTKRPITLYKVERAKGFNPTLPVHADAMYDVDHGIAYETTRKGNALALKSASPRFPETRDRAPGPGSYHCEEFHGAFPILLHVVTPRDAKEAQHQKKDALKHMMGVIPVQEAPTPKRSIRKSALSASTSECKTNLYALQDVVVMSSSDDAACTTSPLVARLTPRNAYNGAYLATPTMWVQPPPTCHRPTPQKVTVSPPKSGRKHKHRRSPRVFLRLSP
ncbi:hypothetical protein SPRG_19370 [Saprolegnia parasitica CBS 223.65]|uniref:Uncharacterized protein n=1 Tax=Saprolegnia parasitica (strain CBS 223.65) TaxID=695850 RepID=A0A067CQN9_SAPPC|nr:hypothetical protein SPRG_19370 [Saprolegnia parasitica CBS 223.65]KDO33019.1 hypothetical protein SPRG_19370 [Saprolegnia parasitica CBS 223.65]|eukprot:XP_012196256.1 hypothetical protein SPRG_19370 [Saprolegnia parasitica CBS 223.65]